MSVAILYAYYENKFSKENTMSFLNNTVMKDTYHIYINVNRKSSVDFSKYNNITNIFYNNYTNAYLSWKHILNEININEYENFIFLKDKTLFNVKTDWINMLIRNINDKIKIVGPFMGFSWSDLPIIGACFFCIDKIGLKLLIDHYIFNSYIKKGLKHKSPEYMLNRIFYDRKYGCISFGSEEHNLYEIRRINGEKNSKDIIRKIYNVDKVHSYFTLNRK